MKFNLNAPELFFKYDNIEDIFIEHNIYMCTSQTSKLIFFTNLNN